MEKRGPKPKGKVEIQWSANFAYAIGLLATDGNLSPDGRHISFASKDIEQIENFKKCLNLKIKTGETISGYGWNRTARVQFGDVLLYRFLETIGLHSNKSKTIGKVLIPKEYFFDFLRGCLDGDGTFYSYWDPRWRSSHTFYIEFASASKEHIFWIKKELFESIGVKGFVVEKGKSSVYRLRYAKKEALGVIENMYYTPNVVCLSRKKSAIKKTLSLEKIQQKRYSARVMPR